MQTFVHFSPDELIREKRHSPHISYLKLMMHFCQITMLLLGMLLVPSFPWLQQQSQELLSYLKKTQMMISASMHVSDKN